MSADRLKGSGPRFPPALNSLLNIPFQSYSEKISRNPKWIARYRVKKALVYNPYCPPSLALYLLKFMVTSDLREIAQSGNLHLAVQEAAYQLLKDKT